MNIDIKIRRLAAVYIDGTLLNIPMAILSFVFHFNMANQGVLSVLCVFILWGVYSIISEMFFLRTLGKKIMSLKIEVPDPYQHSKFTLARVLVVRFICRFIPFDPFSIFFDPDGVMWHDKISNTRVKKV